MVVPTQSVPSIIMMMMVGHAATTTTVVHHQLIFTTWKQTERGGAELDERRGK